jgi:hypothetical protein
VRPFSLKHARQQGAILGHAQRLGLLQARAPLCPLLIRPSLRREEPCH